MAYQSFSSHIELPKPGLLVSLTFDAHLSVLRPVIEAALRAQLAHERMCAVPAKLREAMEYSLLAGGKRLRPALVLVTCDACGGANCDAIATACAFELIHTYSLIHDDLPAMDNDDLRRGRPTSHRVFGDATAILAGDALLTCAFEIIADETEDDGLCRKLVVEIARAAGASGMVGGQQRDLDAEGRTDLTLADLERIHRSKTAALISAATACGAICARADSRMVARMREYGVLLGLAFQIVDDLLDRTATAQTLGKSPGKDEAARKLTYPSVLGIEGAREEARRLCGEAVVISREFPRNEILAAATGYVLDRVS